MFVRTHFKLMADTHASDLFFTVGAPIQIKIRGEVVPLDSTILDPATMNKIAYEAMTEEQTARFERELEINFSLIERGVGSFRVNIFKQRGTCAMVIRHIKVDVPSFEELQLPEVLKDIVMEKRGLVLVVGATGSGKSSTLAAMINHRNKNHLRAHSDDRRSNRVPVLAQQEHREPARGGDRHQVVSQRSGERDA